MDAAAYEAALEGLQQKRDTLWKQLDGSYRLPKGPVQQAERFVMSDTLFWIYLVNAVLLIDHEIDSAYWKEWELFRLPGGIGGFLLIHLPLLGVIVYGLAAVARQLPSGLWFSLLLSAGGLFAFGIHTYFLQKGRNEFDHPVSKGILWATLAVSLCQMALTVYLMAGGAGL